MKNTKKVLIVNPYLDTLGGAEKYILSIASILEQNGYNVFLAWNSKSIFSEIKKRFGIEFKKKLLYLNFYSQSSVERLLRLAFFSIVIYITDGSYFFSSARKTFILAMYPKKSLYRNTLVNRAKWANSKFFTFSNFSSSFISRWTRKKTFVLYPYIENVFFDSFTHINNKKNYILSVGRFFSHLHSKNHLIIIKAFSKLQRIDKKFQDFILYLVGGLKEEDRDYFNKVKKEAMKNKNIIIIPNAEREALIKLYKESLYYWHAAGYDVSKRHPEKVEHLGITTLEAMSCGCIVFSFAAGGQKEIIKNGENGFLFESINDLIAKVREIHKKTEEQVIIQKNAFNFVKSNFSFFIFEKNVKELFL